MFESREGTLALTRFLFFLRRVYKAARFSRIDGFTLAGGLTFSLQNTPVRVNSPTSVNFLIVSRPFECSALGCPGL